MVQVAVCAEMKDPQSSTYYISPEQFQIKSNFIYNWENKFLLVLYWSSKNLVSPVNIELVQ